MHKWIEQMKGARTDFTQSFICLIPTEKMRHAFEQRLLQEVGNYHRVRFMTFYEWVLQETEAYRFGRKVRMIEQSEQVSWVLTMFEQMEDSMLATHQKRIATAEAIVADFMFIRAHGLDEGVVSETMRPLFKKLFTYYDAFLTEKGATDYPQLLEYLLDKKLNIATHLIIFPNEGLSRLERNICDLYRIRQAEVRTDSDMEQIRSIRSYGFGNSVEHALQEIMKEKMKADQMYFVYTNVDLLRTIHEKVEKYRIPATYADGLAIEWTETYYFIEMIIHYIENNQSLHLLKELVDASVLYIGDGKLNNTFERILSIKGMTTGERLLSILANELSQPRLSSHLQGREEEVNVIYTQMRAFHDIISQMIGDTKNVLDGMVQLLNGFFRVRSKREGQAKAVVTRLLREMLVHTNEEHPISLSDLAMMIAGQRIGASSEKPGHLHISAIEDVGPLYRAYYCWFGMTTEEFFTVRNQATFVESKVLESYGIRTEEERLNQLETSFEKKMTNGMASHRLYFTTLHMERVKENNPIPTFKKYEKYLEKIHFPALALTDEGQKHTFLQRDEERVNVSLYATDEKKEDLFTFSPTSAQLLVGCSRKFMYESVMKLREEIVEPVEKRFWLPANLRGDLYHELLEEYMNRRQKGHVDTDLLLDHIFTKFQELYPPIYPRIVEKEKQEATEMLEGFIGRLEEEWKVVAIEEDFGFEEPLLLTFPEHDDIRIQIRGKIDRIDYKESEGSYRVVDYKTGSPKNANPLQIQLYEKAYQHKYKESDMSFGDESFFDFILKDERTYASEAKDFLSSFASTLRDFETGWDEINYKEVKKSLCSYCSFQHMCAIREANRTDE